MDAVIIGDPVEHGTARLRHIAGGDMSAELAFGPTLLERARGAARSVARCP
jgi:hypothetical protein